jgi:serine/threonine protein kinase/tetratricopeptide (TPR) repeat protein
MDDPKSKKGREGAGSPGPQGVGVPAKGDSSSSNVPPGELDGATLADHIPPPKLPVKPNTRVAGGDATYIDEHTSVPTGRQVHSGMFVRETVLQPGDVIGGRYEILLLLGEGGMGAVYKALDRDVERTVALKLIRPELAANPAILARFKQELLTAHQVTHKNVIRIYDMSESDGVKFITMEFVEGSDLRRILIDNGKLPTDRAVEIIRQVCLALDAAHTAGIIHRDLKPQNIMQDAKTGRILVMDFGLARSMASEGMTQTGALLGTIEYMSPEQSMGKTLDARSDIFAVGLIFYELLTGNTPYKADTAMASLLRRNQERAIPAAELDATVPKGLSDIVSKCLERDLTHRYQSVQEILNDLDAFQGARPISASMVPTTIVVGQRTIPWKWISAGALGVVVLSGGGWMMRNKFASPAGRSGTVAITAKVPEVSLAILPFRNASGDASLDWLGSTLADMLSTDVGQSAEMRTISPDRLRQVLSDLRVTPESSIDSTMVGHIADSTSANTVFWGKYIRYENKIRIEGTLQDLKHDRNTPINIDAPSEKDISGTVNQIAEQIRQHLSVSADVLKELKASSFQPSSKSAEALRDYSQGVQFLREGRNLDAVKGLESAVKEDPEFALAYSRLAEANSTLGYDADAERFSRKAVDLSQSLSQGERYLIQAIHAVVTKDSKKALESYENLAKILPNNVDVEYGLGSLYLDNGEYDKARAQFTKILTDDPKNIRALWQMGGVEIVQDNPQASLDPLNKALSQAIQTDNQEEKALILQALGISYRGMNKPQEAMKNYLDSMEISKKLGLKRLQANNLSELAQVQITLGKPDAAMSSYGESLQILRDIHMKKEYGDILINRGVLYQTRGDYDKALQDFKDALQIQRETNDESYQSVCLNNIGDAYFAKGEIDNALTYFQQSLDLRRKLNQPGYLAETLSSLGEVYSALGDYDKSLSNLMSALDVARKANDTSTAAGVSGLIGTVLLSQGRLGAAVSAMQDSVKGYRAANNRSLEMVSALTSLADTLALAGRGSESGKLLDEAQEIARDLKNENINSQILNTRGDVAFYQGDLKTAKSDYDQAYSSATRSKQREALLVSKMNLARVAIAEGRSPSALGDLRNAVQLAESLHLKYYSARSSVDMAQALINTKDYKHARQELDNALPSSEKLGLRLETARIHYFLGEVLRLDGNSTDAAIHYKQARSILDNIKQEQGAEHLVDRSDVHGMYTQIGQSVVAAE